MILIIDNYDSFTYNLVQLVGIFGHPVQVMRNDYMDLSHILALCPTHIIISPGPGSPIESGISRQVIEKLPGSIPILGVCLGHQVIGDVLGASIKHAPSPVHGKTSLVYHDNQGLFHGLSNPFHVIRYHSLSISLKSVPDQLLVNAWTGDGIIMGCQHRLYPQIQGIQFHPESLWTENGMRILKNFLACP